MTHEKAWASPLSDAYWSVTVDEGQEPIQIFGIEHETNNDACIYSTKFCDLDAYR